MRFVPRLIVKALAYIGGYFWLPCPRCGAMFAGFEETGRVWEDRTRANGRCTCPACPDEYFLKEAA